MIDFPLIALIFLLASAIISGIAHSMQRLGKAQIEVICQDFSKSQPWNYPARLLFVKENRDVVNFSIQLTKHLLLIVYAIAIFVFLFNIFPEAIGIFPTILFIIGIIFSVLVVDTLIQVISGFKPEGFFKITSFLASLLLLLFWPLSWSIFWFIKKIPSKKTEALTSFRMKDKILEILHDSEFAPYLDMNDQKLILSVVSFKERIAREVMVPRIDMFTLSADTTIQEAAKSFLKEGYSRIPIYRESVDNVIGVLYYKDVLNIYAATGTGQKQTHLTIHGPIEALVKPVVYTPETKKISHLLQEFRNKHIHLAIVVDEYGGTEGIVTIEDILEELVGEIADEYDFGEEALYKSLPTGGWIVDAKMGILDIEDELGINIPQSPEYDTIGGYIFHKAGTIPSKGWRLHHDDFDLEVLNSNERSIDKIRIAPHHPRPHK